MNNFTFAMDILKAEQIGNDRFIDAVVSDTRLDQHVEHMSSRSLDSMLKFMNDGFVAKDGAHQRVWLIPSHQSSFKIGEAVSGAIRKADDDHLELAARFKLEPPGCYEADVLFKEAQANTCRHQLSVGGEALGRPYYNDTLKKQAIELVDVTSLEHVAVTRPNRSAVKSAGFLRAMMKSVEGASSSDSQGTLHGMLYKTETPQGGETTMTPEQEQALLALVPIVTEMKKDIDARKKAESDAEADAEKVRLQKEADAAKSPEIKTLEDDPNVKKYIESLRVQKEAQDREMALRTSIVGDVKALLEPLAKSLEKVGVPMDRTRSVLNGGKEVAKEEKPLLDGEQPTELSKAITAKKAQLAVIEKEADEIVQKRRAGMKLTDDQELKAQSVSKQLGSLKSEIHYMEATGVVAEAGK